MNNSNSVPGNKARSSWEHFHHGADIGVRGYGNSKETAFTEAAKALIAVITEPGLVEARHCIEITASAPDDEILLVDWLNALIYEIATRNMLFSEFEVNINDDKLTAKACGEAVDVQRHQPAVEVKGATFTELSVTQNSSGQWSAQCVVDV